MIKNTIVSIDTETISLTDKTVVAFSYTIDNQTTVIPVRMNTTPNIPIKQAQKLLIELIQNNTVVFHNSSFDIPVLIKFGISWDIFTKASSEGRIDDTLVMASLIDENIPHGLKSLVKRYFLHEMTEYKALCGTGKKQIPFEDIPWDKAKHYAGEDAEWTLQLYHMLHSSMKPFPALMDLYYKIERPLLIIVADMHIHGITIDVKKVKEISEICQHQIELLETKLRITMGDINYNSPKQLKEYFIDKKHLPVIRTSHKTKQPSVDKEVLTVYAETDIDAKMLLDYRHYTKLYSTFIPALTPTEWDINTWKGKIYANFNQSATSSGRFSSSNPNMQNIPNEDTLGIRKCIVADEGQILVGADYSQIELRILAHFSKDINLMKAYHEGMDIHQQTANACGIERYHAKTINFGLVYGMGAKTLAKRINVAPEEAQQYMDRYFSTYPGVKTFWKDVEEAVRGQGYVKTAYGRTRRRTIYFHAKDDYDQGSEIRSITNAVIQGTAADLMKKAMVTMYTQLYPLGARIVSTIHDEVIVSTPEKYAEKVKDIVYTSMIEAGKILTVPIEVDIKYGHNWQEAHGEGIELNIDEED